MVLCQERQTRLHNSLFFWGLHQFQPCCSWRGIEERLVALKHCRQRTHYGGAKKQRIHQNSPLEIRSIVSQN